MFTAFVLILNELNVKCKFNGINWSVAVESTSGCCGGESWNQHDVCVRGGGGGSGDSGGSRDGGGGEGSRGSGDGEGSKDGGGSGVRLAGEFPIICWPGLEAIYWALFCFSQQPTDAFSVFIKKLLTHSSQLLSSVYQKEWGEVTVLLLLKIYPSVYSESWLQLEVSSGHGKSEIWEQFVRIPDWYLLLTQVRKWWIITHQLPQEESRLGTRFNLGNGNKSSVQHTAHSASTAGCAVTGNESTVMSD